MRLPRKVKNAIDARADLILEGVIYGIEHGKLEDIDDCDASIADTRLDSTAAVDLDLDDKVTLIELQADEYGLELVDGPLRDIGRRLEDLATTLICYLAEDDARSAVFGLDMFLDENGFEFEEIVLSNPYGWARHYAEREEEDAYVYEYRNVEGEIHVDVWEYELMPGRNVYLKRFLKPDEITDEERTFEAN